MADKIGKVIRVVSPIDVVVNLGADDGIKPGLEFLVYILGDEISDPDTGESLGPFEIVRGRGRARHVQPRMTTIRSLERKKVVREQPQRRGPGAFGYSSPFPLTEEVYDTEPFENVQVGDLVRLL